jgi:hypothetical protein
MKEEWDINLDQDFFTATKKIWRVGKGRKMQFLNQLQCGFFYLPKRSLT